MAVGFGASVQRYVARFPSEVSLIAADLDGAVYALEAAVERRRTGALFYAAPLVDEPRAVIAQRLSGTWMEHLTNIDHRYQAFDALAADRLENAGVEISDAEISVVDEPSRRVLRDFTIMGDALLARSWRDAERVARLLGRRRPLIAIASGEDLGVPGTCKARGDALVVWAPLLEATRLGVIAMALEYMKCRVIYVCASGRLQNVRGDFVDAITGTAVLAEAACIIDASISDPASAIALRRCGVPVAAASTSGASEYLNGLLEYEPWNWRSIFAAAAGMRGAEPPVLKREPMPLEEITSTLEHAVVAKLSSEPLVSVIVLTYNRRELLSLAMASIARQEYKNIEIIVVNNGGTDVSDIVGVHDRAQVITLQQNILPNAAAEIGCAAFEGKYLIVLSDDDEYFPDHISRLVGALERANAEVGHTNTVTRYISSESGTRQTIAYRVIHDRTPDRLQLLVGATMTIQNMLFRRDARALLGGFRMDLAPADMEYMLRAAQRFDFVHIDVVTCEWNYMVNGSSYSHSDSIDHGLRTIYEEYPSGDSAIVEGRRRRELERFAERKMGAPLWPPDLYLPERSLS